MSKKWDDQSNEEKIEEVRRRLENLDETFAQIVEAVDKVKLRLNALEASHRDLHSVF